MFVGNFTYKQVIHTYIGREEKINIQSRNSLNYYVKRQKKTQAHAQEDQL